MKNKRLARVHNYKNEEFCFLFDWKDYEIKGSEIKEKMNTDIKQELLLKLAFHEGLSLAQAFRHKQLKCETLEKYYLSMSLLFSFLQRNIFEVAKLSDDKKFFWLKKRFPSLNKWIWNKAIKRLHNIKTSNDVSKEFKKLNLLIKIEESEESIETNGKN